MYYIIYGAMYLFSLLPFFVLYGISNFASFVLYRIVGYRAEIVHSNLKIAFPEKTEKEIKKIARKFYTNLTDTFIETIKLLSLPAKEVDKRAVMDLAAINKVAENGRNIQFQSGHQMNWEFGNFAISRHLNIPWIGIYKRIRNRALDRIFIKLRGRFGARLVASQDFKSKMHIIFKDQYSIGLAADQNPANPALGYWLNFFGRPVPFVTGPDKGAIRNSAVVIFVRMVKVKRGYYRFDTKLISEDASTMPAHEITLQYRDFLEETIRNQPDNYLWSHRRWKWEWNEVYAKKWIDSKPPVPLEKR